MKQLRTRMNALRQQWQLFPIPDDEVKMRQVGRDKDDEKRPNPLLRRGYDRPARARYVTQALASLTRVPTIQVMAVGVDRRGLRPPADDPVVWAFKLLMERFEYSLNSEGERVGMVICDEDNSADARMRTAMYSGTVWTTLPNIAETIMFVPSHHSPGVQFADFVVGAAARWWNYRQSEYLQALLPALRRDRGTWRGVGLKSFPQADYPALGQ